MRKLSDAGAPNFLLDLRPPADRPATGIDYNHYTDCSRKEFVPKPKDVKSTLAAQDGQLGFAR